ncbi:tetraspanin-2A-like [Portunus trituberculatus]|uniref:tetraspanin-2A-like n=1 Tax=Portunus trituberculatus TaxID=210409 RepID=UPI001E1CD6C4|nr:tetraspanin-2A-like [Portunus trituberculatus]XP_045138150.1 tetraspanin-2A-like [Portunus trituberculatus]XP_045138159.1 tetraspanin-2A-like [Portunus trituberculatus]XP_045138166.1 tetraspanin-2A-like [Portunus trituberculatus]XP_045138177.1 tetraspanin-2A-like [Portunus trituberculatus]
MGVLEDVRYTGVGHSEGATRCVTYTLFTLNVVFIVLGAAMVSLGFWITLDTTFKYWVIDLGMEHYWIGVYILMGAGALVMLQSFFGICGAFQRRIHMLVAFMVLLVLCLCLELAGAGYMLANGIRASNIEPWLQTKFLQLIDAFDHDEGSARIMNIVQEWVGCCGANGALDYVRWHKVIPSTCYNPVTGNAWYVQSNGYMGCVRGFTMYLEKMSGWIAGVALFLVFFQVLGLVAAWCLISVKYNYRDQQNEADLYSRRK